MEWRLDDPSNCIKSSRAGLKSTCPNVSHLLTVIDPTRRLTCEIGELLSCSVIVINPDPDLVWILEPDFRELLCEVLRDFFAESPCTELLRSPYPEKNSLKDIGVVGVWTVPKASFIFAFISLL
jgi:hypothetical protein